MLFHHPGFGLRRVTDDDICLALLKHAERAAAPDERWSDLDATLLAPSWHEDVQKTGTPYAGGGGEDQIRWCRMMFAGCDRGEQQADQRAPDGIHRRAVITCYARFVLRVLALILLCCSAADVIGPVVREEPCAITEQGCADESCSPGCVTCSCCAQGREIAGIAITIAPAPAAVTPTERAVAVPPLQPRKIPHVPKAT